MKIYFKPLLISISVFWFYRGKIIISNKKKQNIEISLKYKDKK